MNTVKNGRIFWNLIKVPLNLRKQQKLSIIKGYSSGNFSSSNSISSMACETGLSAIFVTCPNLDLSKSLGRRLIETKSAACCVTVIPQVISIYEWKEKIEEDTECLMIIKTQNSLLAEVIEFVKKNHPDDVAEIITLPITGGSDVYLDFIKKATKK